MVTAILSLAAPGAGPLLAMPRFDQLALDLASSERATRERAEEALLALGPESTPALLLLFREGRPATLETLR